MVKWRNGIDLHHVLRKAQALSALEITHSGHMSLQDTENNVVLRKEWSHVTTGHSKYCGSKKRYAVFFPYDMITKAMGLEQILPCQENVSWAKLTAGFP